MDEEEIKPVKKRPIGLIVLIGVVGMAAFVGLIFLQKSEQVVDYNYTLYMTTKGMNIACPYMVNENVRLDSMAAKYDKQLFYYFTIMEVGEETDEFCEEYEDELVENLKHNSEVKEF